MPHADRPPAPAASATTSAALAMESLRTVLRRGFVAGLVTFVAGLALTALLYRDAQRVSAKSAATRFEYRTERIREDLEHRFHNYEVALRSLAGLISARDDFDRRQWRSYFDTLELAEPYEGRLLMGYAPRVAAQDVAAHERQAQADGAADYRFTAKTPRDSHFPLAYLRRIAPAPGFVRGADLMDDPALRQALASAIASGKSALVGPLAASRSPAEADQVWALAVPVYAGGRTPATVPEREAALRGLLVEAFAVFATVGGALGPDAKLIGLKVRDAQATLPVFTCTELQKELDSGFQPTLTRDADFDWGSRRWVMHFVALPGFMATLGPGQGGIVLATGATISLLLALMVAAFGNVRARTLALLDERTSALRQALTQREASEARLRAVFDNVLDAIITIDPQGLVQSFNPAAERIFGYSAHEVLGHNLKMLMPPHDGAHHDGYLSNYMTGGTAKIIGIGRVVTGQRKDGSWVPLDLAVSEMRVEGQRLFCGIVRDITERKAAEDALRQSEAKLRSYIEQALEGVLVVDRGGRCIEGNPALCAMLGLTPAELLTLSVPDILWPDADEMRQGLAHFARVIDAGRSHGEVALRRKDGTRVVAEVNGVALGNERYLGTLRDVTQRRVAEEALQEEREQLELRVQERTEVLSTTNTALAQEVDERRRVEHELVAAREQALQAADVKAGFLANMSHEIRTPLNAVLGMSALLDGTPLDPEQRDYVQTIRVSSDALLAVINDILDFSKIESGMLDLERRPFELGACIEEAFDMLAPRAAEKAIELCYDIAEGLPQWLLGDAARLRQVFVNLLSNAVKFTHRGEVVISTDVVAITADEVRLRFAVRDTGIGISGPQMQHLFKAFSQADSSTTRQYGGTGLGLAISARLVRLMGGELRADSVQDQGSTFHFTLALGLAQQMPPSRFLSGHSPDLAGRRILVVDDNPTNLKVLQVQCQRWGLDVTVAHRATLALALLEAEAHFDAALLDFHMPGMDGMQLAQAIQAQCGATAPALVLLSSSAWRGDRSGERSGASLFAARLAKPVKLSQLHQVLVRLLNPGTTATPSSPSRTLDPTLATRLPMKILVVEDSEINQRLATRILAKLGYRSDVADNGLQALTLASQTAYDLIFMDLQMPVMDGLEATRRIHATAPPAQRPRIVAMTANAMAGDRERCLDAGMDDYIAKPILPADIRAVIERWSMPAAGRSGEVPLIDLRIVQELQALDEPGKPSLLQTLLRDFLAEVPGSIGAIKQHAARGELLDLAQRAHKLAGISATLGAAALADTCCRIEQQLALGLSDGVQALIDELERRFVRTRAEFARLGREGE